jgi:hypothetical protein
MSAKISKQKITFVSKGTLIKKIINRTAEIIETSEITLCHYDKLLYISEIYAEKR